MHFVSAVSHRSVLSVAPFLTTKIDLIRENTYPNDLIADWNQQKKETKCNLLNDSDIKKSHCEIMRHSIW